MRLLKLRLSNFKGIKDFELNADGKDILIFGANGTGKTTICDAIYWLLFDKDSQFKKQFEIKTLNRDGEAEHGLDHEIEAAFLIDGKTVTLKKVYHEKWTKKRGDAQKQFTGHETEYFVDGVPVKKKEYTDRTAALFDEEAFKLLTTPTYFSETLPWKQRRDLLIEICGDVNSTDIINSNPDLKPLESIFEDRTIEDHQAIVKAQKAEINKELEKIPVRIDEINRNVPDIKSIDEKKERAVIANMKALIESNKAKVMRINSGGEVAEKTKELTEIEAELRNIENTANKERDKAVKEKREKLNVLYNKKGDIVKKHRIIKSEIVDSERKIEVIEKQLDDLRKDWYAWDAKKFEPPEQENVCPACGQDIPESMKAEAIKKALSDFNLKKSNALESINNDGSDHKAALEKLRFNLSYEVKAEEILSDSIAAIDTQIKSADKELEQLTSYEHDLSKNTEYVKLNDRKIELAGQIEKLRDGCTDEIQAIETETVELNLKLESALNNLMKLKAADDYKYRLKELKDHEKLLSGEYENLEKETFLIEEFIRCKVDMLEEKINSKFKMARFKLFQEQINGGLSECCEVTHNGVPYNSGLNNGARVTVGIDIIRTLQEHYGMHPFIMIDNREAITDDIEIDCQVISFVVSKGDEVLRVEV